MQSPIYSDFVRFSGLVLVFLSGMGFTSGATLEFAGKTWTIKQSTNPVGPGPNRFSSSPNDVWSDQAGLHLSIHKTGPYWYSTEVILSESLGYGTYMFQTNSRQDILNANAVFGAFTWDPHGGDTIPGNPNREIDFEDSRWGNAADPTNSQAVIQPYYVPGNLERITLPDLSSNSALTRFFTWSPGKVEFTTLRGQHTPTNYSPEDVIHQYTYTNDGTNHIVPTPGQEAFRFNLWLYNSSAPVGEVPVELLINDFQFFPLAATPNLVLFDFETGNQSWASYGAITTDSGQVPNGGSVGQGRYHSADYSLPDAGNFGIVDVSPSHQDLSSFVGLSLDALFKNVPGQPAFVGVKELDIIVATGSGPSEEEFFAPKVTLSDEYQTYSVRFDTFQSGLTSLPPTTEQLSDVIIKLVVLNSNGTGTAQLNYDQITGLGAIDNADFNGDFRVDGADFLVWQRGFGTGTSPSMGDANNSGSVDYADLIVWQDQYGTQTGLPSATYYAVPEPISMMLTITGMMIWFSQSRLEFGNTLP